MPGGGQRQEGARHLTDLNVEEDLVGDGRSLLLGLGATHHDGTAERGGHGELGEHFNLRIEKEETNMVLEIEWNLQMVVEYLQVEELKEEKNFLYQMNQDTSANFVF